MDKNLNVWKTGFYNADRLELFSNEELERNELLRTSHSKSKININYKSDTRSCLEIYEKCIIPYITSETNVLEIGPGRGAWTLKMSQLNPNTITCLDIFSAEHNSFWELLGNEKKSFINYHQIEENNCKELKDESIDFLFSYDVFCHIPYRKCEQYLKNLYNKLKLNTVCVIMIADYKKSVKNNQPLARVRGHKYNSLQEEIDDIDGPFYHGRFYYYGIDKFCELLEKYNYTVINKDIDLDKQNPICIFKK
tara:strand:- start:2738 stop:3490 length:753 start_codon:yes stop_codon:yes gene_type:complete